MFLLLGLPPFSSGHDWPEEKPEELILISGTQHTTEPLQSEGGELRPRARRAFAYTGSELSSRSYRLHSMGWHEQHLCRLNHGSGQLLALSPGSWMGN